MLPFKQILFPVDFSSHCREAALQVEWLAEEFKAHVTLVHVFESLYGPIRQEVFERAELRLRSFLPGQFPRANVDCIVRNGRGLSGGVAEEIVSTAASIGADLIMMPVYCDSTQYDFLIGSVTAKVLHDSACPVWTAAPAAAGSSAGAQNTRSVVCAVDTKAPEPERLVREAAEIAVSCGATLTLVEAAPMVEDTLLVKMAPEFMPDLLNPIHQSLQSLVNNLNIKASACVASGPVSLVVRHSALSHQASLVVIGRGRFSRTSGHVGANAYAIVRDAPCPVISI